MSKLIIIIISLYYIPLVFSQEAIPIDIIYNPIGVFYTNYTPQTGAPRQGVLIPESKATIEMYPKYHSALKDLSLFEYIIVIYHFSEVESWAPTVNPPSSTHDHDFGLFSTRSPKRPNPIGFAVIKLDRIKNGILYVSGVDAFNGTPVLDIKPYLPTIDCINSVQNELIEKEFEHHDVNFINDSTFFK